ncbi:myophilin [Diprion similis]|uniref:myophilin n=1 Tax=Diprion similis TaxID=362088 RepID=UPI001EF9263F|nr:myophilin [Diprion similis]XP_046740419.1 myophilin [Diprion similis]XP_046740420.1 myophilin [Diprion similis]XP_046740421.1 myophilin [Diprion similis]XP_046740422.1 myophilin [Diprion similis]XP_046740424.1 myophilin [Diprion similis]XP_046740425.1 myophilin [Diprion similis]XP_046740426.1 myophilin [Diprion similis]XP_046740427.1 myophilin [Diprion similis]XP_046740428.1 myophilin [Diprion similis]XP_046740429.1 myophilin [Diprion similis]
MGIPNGRWAKISSLSHRRRSLRDGSAEGMTAYSVATPGVKFSLYSTRQHRSKTHFFNTFPTPDTRQISNMPPRNKEQEAEILAWIEAVTGEKLPPGNYEDILKDGVVLCNLINKLAPGSVKKIQTKGTNFQLMENVQRFQAAIKAYGVPQEEIFQTADLFERRNIAQVTLCLYALGRITQKHPEYNGPRLGPKMAEKNEREFTEAQLRASEGQVNLQMGYNKGASQSGHGGFGNTRHM